MPARREVELRRALLQRADDRPGRGRRLVGRLPGRAEVGVAAPGGGADRGGRAAGGPAVVVGEGLEGLGAVGVVADEHRAGHRRHEAGGVVTSRWLPAVRWKASSTVRPLLSMACCWLGGLTSTTDFTSAASGVSSPKVSPQAMPAGAWLIVGRGPLKR